MIRFFRKRLRPGMPLSTRGLFGGLDAMERAWQTLSVHNGHVTWHNGRPKIIVDSAGDSLPSTEGKSRYMVLALDSDLNYDWDDPRIRIE